LTGRDAYTVVRLKTGDKIAGIIGIFLVMFVVWQVGSACVEAMQGKPRFAFLWAETSIISISLFMLLIARPPNSARQDIIATTLTKGKRSIIFWSFAGLFSVFIAPQLFFFYFHSQGYVRCDDHQLQREGDEVGRPTVFRYWVLDASECLPYENRNEWIGKVFSKD
jgi:hypothetical protein